MHHQICSNTQVFVCMFDTRMVLSFTIEKMAIVGLGNKKIATTLVLAAVNDAAVVVTLKDTAQKHVI